MLSTASTASPPMSPATSSPPSHNLQLPTCNLQPPAGSSFCLSRYRARWIRLRTFAAVIENALPTSSQGTPSVKCSTNGPRTCAGKSLSALFKRDCTSSLSKASSGESLVLDAGCTSPPVRSSRLVVFDDRLLLSLNMSTHRLIVSLVSHAFGLF